MAARKKSAGAADGDTPAETPSIEDLLTRIDTIVERLEDETAPLDSAIRDFEDGMALTRQAQSLLQSAEQRVQILLDEGDDAATIGDDESDD